MRQLVARLETLWPPFESRICVDTAPLLERAYAQAAGLGWIGKNTCLINQADGSWFFLGEVLISLEILPDSPPPDRCGTCRRCIDACPTDALIPGPGAPGPAWQLDGRACISTLTIETKGSIPEARREGVGLHLFGCDICQEVCPWNSRSVPVDVPGFFPMNDRWDLDELSAMSRDEFRERFRKTPVWRSKWQGLMRNTAVAIGNSGDARHKPALERLAACGDEVVEEHARWALGRLEGAGK